VIKDSEDGPVDRKFGCKPKPSIDVMLVSGTLTPGKSPVVSICGFRLVTGRIGSKPKSSIELMPSCVFFLSVIIARDKRAEVLSGPWMGHLRVLVKRKFRVLSCYGAYRRRA